MYPWTFRAAGNTKRVESQKDSKRIANGWQRGVKRIAEGQICPSAIRLLLFCYPSEILLRSLPSAIRSGFSTQAFPILCFCAEQWRAIGALLGVQREGRRSFAPPPLGQFVKEFTNRSYFLNIRPPPISLVPLWVSLHAPDFYWLLRTSNLILIFFT